MTIATRTRKTTRTVKNADLPIALITNRRVTNARFTAIGLDGAIIATNSDRDVLAERLQRTHAVAFEVKIKAPQPPKQARPVQKTAKKPKATAKKTVASVQAKKPVKQERTLVVKASPNDGYAFSPATFAYLPLYPSRFIHSARYQARTNTLLVNIAANGDIYTYEYLDVPEQVYHKLMTSRSPGKVYNYAVKGVYDRA